MAKNDFVFYDVDTSFDYGDFPNATCYCHEPSGFTLDIDYFENINLSSLYGFGDFSDIEERCTTLELLKQEIIDNLQTIDGSGSPKSDFLYLLDILTKQIERAA